MNTTIRRFALLAAANIALGLALFGFMYWNESMRVPLWAESPVRALYNTLFGFTLPMQGVSEVFRDRMGHTVPVGLRFAAYSLTPIAVSVFLWLVYAARRAQMSRRAQRTGKEMSRRRFLIQTSDMVVMGGAAAAGGYSTWLEPSDLTVRRYDAPIMGLPDAMDGYSLVQISDTHYGPFISLRHIRRAIELANSLKPDFTVLTGDYVHRSPRAIEHGVGIMSEVRARHGVAAVLGNHDHWEDAEECRRVFGGLKIPMLDNARMFLTAKGIVEATVPGDGICLGGVGDLWTDVVNVRYALRGVDPDVPRVLLSHNPDVAEDPGNFERVDLMLSGHTHGGQISVPFKGTILVPSAYGKKYAGGWCKGPRFPVIVSRGVGLAVMPYRFRVPPEIVHVTLRKLRA